MNKMNGFTLIELMVTIAIIGILAAIAIPSYNDYIEKGEIADAKQAAVAMLQSFERNRIARPREYQSVTDVSTKIAAEKAKLSPRITRLYNFETTVIPSKNNASVALGFSLVIKPKGAGKKYRATLDMQGNAQRCVIKTNQCVKF